MPEAWKPVPGYEGRYEISTGGRVRSLRRSKVLIPKTNFRGYFYYTLYDGLRARTKFAHRLFWSAFIGPIPHGLQVNHIDGNKKNNALENLELVTPAENVEHSLRTGLSTPPRPVMATHAKTGRTLYFRSTGEAIRKLGLPEGNAYTKKYRTCKGWVLKRAPSSESAEKEEA